MTTILYDPSEGVASDSQETDSGRKRHCIKLYKVEDHIIATAGGTYAGMLFVEWFREWEDGEPDWSDCPDLVNLDSDEDFECLVIRPDGSAYTVNRLFTPVECDVSDFIALGSGAAAALGAVSAGVDVKAAVRIACRIDAWSSGKIQFKGRRAEQHA